MAEELSYNEALRILGFKKKPSEEDLKKRYRQLSKKYHPDLNKEKNAAEQMVAIVNAKRRLSLPAPIKVKFIDFKKEYQMLKNRVDPFSLDIQNSENRLNEVYAGILKTKKYRSSEENEKKLRLARDLIDQQLDFSNILRSKLYSRKKQAIMGSLSSPEERMQNLLEKYLEKNSFREDLHAARSNIVKRSKGIMGNVKRVVQKKIPIIKKINGKKVIVYTLVTAGLASAIAAGFYFWNKRAGAYEPRLLEGPK